MAEPQGTKAAETYERSVGVIRTGAPPIILLFPKKMIEYKRSFIQTKNEWN